MKKYSIKESDVQTTSNSKGLFPNMVPLNHIFGDGGLLTYIFPLPVSFDDPEIVLNYRIVSHSEYEDEEAGNADRIETVEDKSDNSNNNILSTEYGSFTG
jgi:hypothetical protein